MDIFPFIVGAGRSGTTLLRAMFDSHPDMAIPGETAFIVRLHEERKRYESPLGFSTDRFVHDLSRLRRFREWGLPPEDVLRDLRKNPVESYADAIRRLYRLQAERAGKRRYGDKTPTYVSHLPLLARLFPEAKFIHILRDPRDVALSRLDLEGWGARSLEEAALNWRRTVRRGLEGGRSLEPVRYREVRYEDLIESPEATLKALCSFVDLTFDDQMLRYFERAEELAAGMPHFKSLYRPPTKGLRDWRRQMSTSDVAVVEELVGELLDELGYERDGAPRSTMTRIIARSRALRVGLRQAVERVGRTVQRSVGAPDRHHLPPEPHHDKYGK